MTHTTASAIGGGVGAVIDPGGGADPLQIDRDYVIDRYRSTGAVFFRGFGASVETFEALSASFTQDLVTNRGAAFSFGPFQRSTVKGDPTLMTATGRRQDFALPLHGEFYYFKHPPAMIWFYCAQPAPEGGETTIGDGLQAMATLAPATADLIRRRRIRYERRFLDGEWQAAFQTSNRDAVEAIARENAATVSWAEDGALVTEYVCRAYLVDDRGREILINGVLPVALGEDVIVSGRIADIAPAMAGARPSLVVRWEDGTPLDRSVVKDMLAVASRIEVPVPARAGDMLMIDNRRILHGRRASSSADRQVLVRMGAPRF